MSQREFEILELGATGTGNMEIAAQHAISASIVKVHVRNIINELKVNSRAKAAHFAIRNDLFGDNATYLDPGTCSQLDRKTSYPTS